MTSRQIHRENVTAAVADVGGGVVAEWAIQAAGTPQEAVSAFRWAMGAILASGALTRAQRRELLDAIGPHWGGEDGFDDEDDDRHVGWNCLGPSER